jgi:hypothetical protein
MSTTVNSNISVAAGPGIWTPPAAVTEHQGDKLSPECDFFVAPPTEIGEVRNAHTSLKRGTHAKTTPVRLVIAAIAIVLGYVAAVGFNMFTHLLMIPASLTHTPIGVWALLVGLLPGYIAWRKTSFEHFCTFVGREGCAQIECKGERENITKNSVFLFRGAKSVSTSFVRHIKNGRYNYTNYYFYWYPPESEKAIYEITGSHSTDAKTPPPGNPYNFARAAESAWYDYLIPKIDAELAQNGFIKFYMGHRRWACVGRGFIEIVDKEGKSSRCEADDIGSAKLETGYLTICRKGAKASRFDLFSKEGVFRFDYAVMHNARLFLYAFEKLLNVKVT